MLTALLHHCAHSPQVGPVPVGNNTFEFNADPPALSRLPSADDTLSPLGPPVNDLIGVTVIILSALYKDKEFVRVGYYVASNWETSEYQTQVEEGLITGELDKIVRTVEVAQPRVTRFANSWCVPLLPCLRLETLSMALAFFSLASAALLTL